ncbi:hypothetical protein LLG96_20215 [bacterium]|nr:hypothetical protein [bacterium]
MNMLFGAVLAWLMLPLSTPAQEKGISPAHDSPEQQSSVLYIAQNRENTKEKDDTAPKEEEKAGELPFPLPKNIITPEKPIKGAPDGIVREKKPVGTTPQQKEPGKEEESQEAETTPVLAPADSGKTAESPAKTPGTRRTAVQTRKSELVREELSIYNVPIANLRTMKTIIDDDFNLRGIVYGEEKGFIRQLEADNDGNFKEIWKSPPLTAPVRGIFVDDIDSDGEPEIVAYTTQGNIFIYGYRNHDLKYRTPEQTYLGISCMIVANIDDDPQKEILFIANKPGLPGKLVQFDPKSQFEEWTSTQVYTATDMVIGNVDTDPEVEIILNSGTILSSKFKNVKWESDIPLGDRLYLIDVDSDGILELVTEYEQSYIRIIDVDERREKW